MCDINDTRKSRRKQCAPSRHSNIGRATVISISDESNNAIINNEMMNNNGATVMNEDRISDRDGIDSAGLLECEQYLQQQDTDPIQRQSSSTASSTSSLSTATDSNSLSFDGYRKEMFSDHCSSINPMHALYLPVAFHNHSVNSIQVITSIHLLTI
ncbi:unnamed protein product [Onchocerca flexuosa]|uniref:Uncharacterized protein n=1 Tax=Onchocerca flexuosa TaxID=387005 RepID=A0A183HK38_9BILA|nr:unnamed protein product [Onchocerca flexuosa]